MDEQQSHAIAEEIKKYIRGRKIGDAHRIFMETERSVYASLPDPEVRKIYLDLAILSASLEAEYGSPGANTQKIDDDLATLTGMKKMLGEMFPTVNFDWATAKRKSSTSTRKIRRDEGAYTDSTIKLRREYLPDSRKPLE